MCQHFLIHLSFTPGRIEGSQSSSCTNTYFSGFLSSFIPFMEDSSWQGVSARCQLSYLILRCVPKIVERLQCLRGRKLPETVPPKESLTGRSQAHWTAWGRWHATSVRLISPVLSTNLLVKGAVLKVNYQYFSIRRCKNQRFKNSQHWLDPLGQPGWLSSCRLKSHFQIPLKNMLRLKFCMNVHSSKQHNPLSWRCSGWNSALTRRFSPSTSSEFLNKMFSSEQWWVT